MNTDEKQRLNTNELGQAVRVVGHRLEEHATKIVVAICVVLVVAAGITWWSRQVNTSTVNAWTLLETAQSTTDYELVVEKYRTTPAGRWAALRLAEMQLQSGMSNMFTDRELAVLDLKRSKAGFEELLGEKSLDPVIRERALWGLALTLETTSDGDTTKAVEAYRQLLNEVPDTIFKPLAEQRVTELKTGGAKEFYAWFFKQAPKPAESRPKDGVMKDDKDSALPSPSDFRPNPPKSDQVKPGPESSEKPPVKAEEGTSPAKEESNSVEKPATELSTPDPKDPGPKN